MPEFCSRSAVPRLGSLVFFASIGWAGPGMAQSTSSIDAPAAFVVSGRSTIVSLHGVGAQIYECKVGEAGTKAWTVREPIASLILEGRTIGRHYAGPNWELEDGGGIKAKLVTSQPSATPDDIPLLELQVVEHRGTGLLSEANIVLRLHTSGGILKGACDTVGALKSVPYQADYLFMK